MPPVKHAQKVIACQRCRVRHQKCSGGNPCTTCSKHSLICRYTDPEKKIIISLSLYESLKAENEELKVAFKKLTDTDSSSSSPYDTRSDEQIKGKEIDTDLSLSFTQDPSKAVEQGQPFQGTSSMSMFGLEIRGVMPNTSVVDLSEPMPYWASRRPASAMLLRKGLAFHLEIFREPKGPPILIDITLPRYKKSLQAHEAFETYLSGSFYFMNAATFRKRLETTYGSMHSGHLTLSDLLWLSQLIVVVSLGELYLHGSKKNLPINLKISCPYDDGFVATGLESVAVRSLQNANCLVRILLNDINTYPSLEAVEAMLLSSFSHQVMNSLSGAYIFIGHALRISMLLGLHVDAGRDKISKTELEHRRRLWWSIYHLDGYISVKAGFPITVPEHSILTQLAQDIELDEEEELMYTFPKAAYLNSFVELTKIMNMILSQLYQQHPSSKRNVFPAIQNAISRLLEWKDRWGDQLGGDYSWENYWTSRTAANIYHEYYHCVNLAVRPLIFHFVRKRIAERQGTIDVSNFSPVILNLLNASMSSSIQTVRSLSYLISTDTLATFGYLDREAAFMSASMLQLFVITFGVGNTCSPYIQKALEILEHGERNGNRLAGDRKIQLTNMISGFKFLDEVKEEEEVEGRFDTNGHTVSVMNHPLETTAPPLQQSAQPDSGRTGENNPIGNGGVTDLLQSVQFPLNNLAADYPLKLDTDNDLWEEISAEAAWLGDVSQDFASLLHVNHHVQTL